MVLRGYKISYVLILVWKTKQPRTPKKKKLSSLYWKVGEVGELKNDVVALSMYH